MIFVTVGTHEQPFDRLVKCVDELKRDGLIKDQVFIQTGFSKYEPQYCEWCQMIPYRKMDELISAARIVITHGGPSSFVAPLKIGKIPIVVPRRREFGEHVNDHQVEFCRAVAQHQKNIIKVEDVSTLGDVLDNYDSIVLEMAPGLISNNKHFVENFESIVNELMEIK